jgi:hypothetical protein
VYGIRARLAPAGELLPSPSKNPKTKKRWRWSATTLGAEAHRA